MECKRTGEFAHRESTHYESGEAFNGEVNEAAVGLNKMYRLSPPRSWHDAVSSLLCAEYVTRLGYEPHLVAMQGTVWCV